MEIDIILSPKQAQAFRDRINRDGSDAKAIDDTLSRIKSEEATASFPADLTAIRALIQQYSGGFGTLNDTVRLFLRQWFVSQGGIKVVARAGNTRGRRSTALAAPPRPVAERVRMPRIAAANPVTSAHFVGHASPAESQSRIVMNPAWGLTLAQPSAHGRTSGPTGTLPRRPGTRSLAPSPPATIGRQRSPTARRRRGGPAAGGSAAPVPAAGPTVLPAASAAASSGVGGDNQGAATDAGYMDVEGSLPDRQESDVSVLTDTGLGQQVGDVSRSADRGILPRRLSAVSNL